MAKWQKKGEGRIGNTAEPFDAPVSHFSRSPEGRAIFGLRRSHAVATNHSSLMGFSLHRSSSFLAGDQKSQRRGHGILGKEA
jgi:hypothetical protein